MHGIKMCIRDRCEYCGTIKMHIVPFTHIQEQIRQHCPEDLFTIIMRRFMMRISQRVAKASSCEALITGESMGPVSYTHLYRAHQALNSIIQKNIYNH